MGKRKKGGGQRGEKVKKRGAGASGIRGKMWKEWWVGRQKPGNASEILERVVEFVDKLVPSVVEGKFREELKKVASKPGAMWNEHLLHRREALLSVTMDEFCKGLKGNLVYIMKTEKQWERIFRCGEIVVGAFLQVCLCGHFFFFEFYALVEISVCVTWRCFRIVCDFWFCCGYDFV